MLNSSGVIDAAYKESIWSENFTFRPGSRELFRRKGGVESPSPLPGFLLPPIDSGTDKIGRMGVSVTAERRANVDELGTGEANMF